MKKTKELDDNTNFYYVLKKFKKKFDKKLNMWITKDSLKQYILDIDIRLKEAYYLTVAYREFNKSATHENRKEELDSLIDKFYNSTLNQFIDLAKTLSTWKEYLINSFITIENALTKPSKKGEIPQPRRLSSGGIEGLNSILEKLNINSNGYSNFLRFRKRAIYVVNKDLVIKNIPSKYK